MESRLRHRRRRRIRRRVEDIVETIYYITVVVPPRVNVNVIEPMPVAQAFSPFAFKRS